MAIQKPETMKLCTIWREVFVWYKILCFSRNGIYAQKIKYDITVGNRDTQGHHGLVAAISRVTTKQLGREKATLNLYVVNYYQRFHNSLTISTQLAH